jgi:hypothetical protein
MMSGIAVGVLMLGAVFTAAFAAPSDAQSAASPTNSRAFAPAAGTTVSGGSSAADGAADSGADGAASQLGTLAESSVGVHDPWAKLKAADWALLLVAAVGVGVSKSGLSGIGMVHVLIFAFVFGGRVSTGILLPLLIVGDVCAVRLVGRDVLWANVRRLLPPALAGVAVGWLLLGRLEEQAFKPLIGGIILALSVGQLMRMWRPELFARVPHTTWFVWMMGTLAGVTTMLANAAGPIVALYLLAISLPKTQLVATAAWFFLIVNCVKVPLSANLGLIGPTTLAINLLLSPCVVVGLVVGRWIVARIPQRAFDSLILAFTAAGALRLSGLI